MLGKSTLAKRMKRRSALASDWLEKNQSEIADSSLNVVDPVLNVSSHGSDNKLGYLSSSRRAFSGEFDSGSVVKQTEYLPKTDVANSGKVSPKKVSVTDNDTGVQLTNGLEKTSFGDPKKNKTSNTGDSKLTSNSDEHSSCSIETNDNSTSSYDSNTDLFRAKSVSINGRAAKTSSCANNAESLLLSRAAKSPYTSNTSTRLCNNKTDLPPRTSSTKSRNEENGSSATTKRKRSQTAEASSTPEHVAPSLSEDDMQEKPAKIRKAFGGPYEDINMKQIEIGDVEKNCAMGGESEDERSQSCKSRTQRNGVKR